MTNTNERFDASVVITDLETYTVTSTADVPAHLAENWTHEDMAQWAVENDDATVGRRAVVEDTEEPDVFGERGESYTLYYRAGARFQVALTVTYWERRFTVKSLGDGTAEFVTEEAAMRWAEFAQRGPGDNEATVTLGTTEVVV